MAGSNPNAPTGTDPQAASPLTPGPLGKNDAADPNLKIPAGDTQGPVGVNDKAAAQAGTPAAAPKTDADIEALDLSATAKKAAYELKRQYPAITFTSGRRDKAEQASAMASNVVQNRTWIQETYSQSAASKACQKWVDDNKDKKKQAEIADGLKGVLDGLTDAELAQLSKHLSGDAFDVQPVDKDADGIKKAIRALPGLGKFLEKEGGLVRWHAQF
ncbi:MAG: hypothetical protein P4L26_06900 [Terracidiphilus sp.]|nr:hypothetical protein [Terracidiphilus sp.]